LRHLNLVATSDWRPIQNSLNILVQEGVLLHQDSMKTCYRWTHDRYQLSAYSLVPKHEQKSKSIQIGRQLLGNHAPEEVAEHAFLISGLFLQDLVLLVDPTERIQVAHLLRVAGSKAGD
jgi:predicted ATPase